MNPHDLLDVAQTLISTGRGHPRRVYRRRGVSSIYYALFHALSNCCADALVGPTGHKYNRDSWQQTYRALEHKRAKELCLDVRMRMFPDSITKFAELFVMMQTKRHQADYDPYARFYKTECLADLAAARRVIDAFAGTGRPDKLAFAVFLLFGRRRP